jgi:hypothetical protein
MEPNSRNDRRLITLRDAMLAVALAVVVACTAFAVGR